jgi:hypothetical protein
MATKGVVPVLALLAMKKETTRVLTMAKARHATALITDRDALSPLFFLPQLTCNAHTNTCPH